MPAHEISSDGISLNYLDVGNASRPAVVLLHGFPFTSALWLPQLDALGERYRVIAPDLRGFGASALGSQDPTMARLADEVAELIAAAAPDAPSAAIAGLSMGGYIAFELYRRHADRVSALILADTRPHPDSDEARANRAELAQLAIADGAAAVAEKLAPKLLAAATRSERPEIERDLRAMMKSVEPQTIAAALMGMAARADSRPHLANIRVPTLVIVGAEDALAPPSEAREWATQIPDARLEVIDGAGHVSNLERPDAFNAAALAFLDRVFAS